MSTVLSGSALPYATDLNEHARDTRLETSCMTYLRGDRFDFAPSSPYIAVQANNQTCRTSSHKTKCQVVQGANRAGCCREHTSCSALCSAEHKYCRCCSKALHSANDLSSAPALRDHTSPSLERSSWSTFCAMRSVQPAMSSHLSSHCCRAANNCTAGPPLLKATIQLQLLLCVTCRADYKCM